MRKVADLAAYANNPRTHSPDQVAQIADETEADHRDPAQWLFFIVPAKQLPQDQKTISRTVVEKRWSAVRCEQLREMTLNTSKKLLKV